MSPHADTAIIKLIAENLHELKHRDGLIKYTQFDHRFAANPAAIAANRTRFAEAIVGLLAEHGYRITTRRANAARDDA